jgi:hypothetical protein
MDEDAEQLRFEIMRTDSLGIAMGGTTGQPDPVPPMPLQLADGSPTLSMVAAYSALRPDRQHCGRLHARRASIFPARALRQPHRLPLDQSFLTVPMKNHEGESSACCS